jgi:hypothetical protein
MHSLYPRVFLLLMMNMTEGKGMIQAITCKVIVMGHGC